MRLGIEAAFRVANASGGVQGRQLRLIAADDGYEPARTAVTMEQLYEKDEVFAVVGNVGTPTAAVGLPYALDRKMLFFWGIHRRRLTEERSTRPLCVQLPSQLR